MYSVFRDHPSFTHGIVYRLIRVVFDRDTVLCNSALHFTLDVGRPILNFPVLYTGKYPSPVLFSRLVPSLSTGEFKTVRIKKKIKLLCYLERVPFINSNV